MARNWTALLFFTPQNNPALTLLDISKQTVVGDFNAHFHDV
jgi:hypothetical protein